MRRTLISLAVLAVITSACGDRISPSVHATSTTHEHSSGHEHSGPTPESVATAMAAADYQEAGQQGTWDYMGPATTARTLDAATLESAARSAVASNGWETLDGAKSDGFEHLSKIVDPLHFFKREYLDDGVTGDPGRPESLVYDPTTGKLLAVMLLMPLGEHGPAVTGVEGARWHAHAVADCYGSDLMVPMAAPTDGGCPKGMKFGLWSPEMFHVWFVGDDVFSSKMPDAAADGLAEANRKPGGK